MSGNRWSVKLSEHHNFNIFTDELTYLADEFKKLPFGVLALVVDSLRDIKTGEETAIDESDWHHYEKMYYFISGVLLSKTDKELEFEDHHLDRLEELLEMLVTKVSLLEGHFAGILDTKFVDGAWMYGMTEDKAVEFLREFRNT